MAKHSTASAEEPPHRDRTGTALRLDEGQSPSARAAGNVRGGG